MGDYAWTDMSVFEDGIRKRLEKGPQIPASVFIAPSAVVVGHVEFKEHAALWYHATIRGDVDSVYVGEGTNIQDNAVLHVADAGPCRIGDYCTIGHTAIVHACTVGHECLIGMGATLLDGCEIGDQCIVGAHSLVTQKTKIPPGSMVLGAPAKVVRSLTEQERQGLKHWAQRYVLLARLHREKLSSTPVSPQ